MANSGPTAASCAPRCPRLPGHLPGLSSLSLFIFCPGTTTSLQTPALRVTRAILIQWVWTCLVRRKPQEPLSPRCSRRLPGLPREEGTWPGGGPVRPGGWSGAHPGTRGRGSPPACWGPSPCTRVAAHASSPGPSCEAWFRWAHSSAGAGSRSHLRESSEKENGLVPGDSGGTSQEKPTDVTRVLRCTIHRRCYFRRI